MKNTCEADQLALCTWWFTDMDDVAGFIFGTILEKAQTEIHSK